MINRVVLVGRLTRDIDLRYTQSGDAHGQFSLAVNRQFTNRNGEREADFINCVIWRKSAENFSNFTRKGSLVGIEGRIQTRSYDNQQGQRVYVTEVVVDNFSLLESRATTEARPSAPVPSNTEPQPGQSAFGSQPYQLASQTPPATSQGPLPPADPFANDRQPIDVSDDDLPF